MANYEPLVELDFRKVLVVNDKFVLNKFETKDFDRTWRAVLHRVYYITFT